MVRTVFSTGGGAIPAETGAFRCENFRSSGRSSGGSRRRTTSRTKFSTSGSRTGTAGRRNGVAKVFHPDAARLKELGFESVAHVPVLFDGRHRYCRHYNRYLQERARLEWHPTGDADIPGAQTLKNIAHHLANWIEWCEASSIEFSAATYEDVLQYQEDQETGRWSAKGGALNPATANVRADEATHFLTWAAAMAIRPAFDVKRFSVKSRRPGGPPVLARVGRAKESRPAGKKHLWVILGSNERVGEPLFSLTEPLVKAVKHLGLSHLTGDDRAHVHRWRHTVARLVALSVVGAPQVLFDLFGHRDLDMTLRYMLSAPKMPCALPKKPPSLWPRQP
jgi:hypothetical protein